MSILAKQIEDSWATVSELLTIRNERDYDAAIAQMNALLDEIGTDERHPLYGLLDTLATLVHDYEERHHALPNVTGVDMLRFLMDEHGLAQRDLREIGSQGVISEILSGKRKLNVRQIRALAERFHVSPAVFV